MANQDDQRLRSRRLAAILRAEIEANRYPVGSKLPGYRQLATDHDVAVNTVGAAVQLLAKEGFVEVRAASGVYVLDRTASPSTPDLRSELTELRNQISRTRRDLDAAEQTITTLLNHLPSDEVAT